MSAEAFTVEDLAQAEARLRTGTDQFRVVTPGSPLAGSSPVSTWRTRLYGSEEVRVFILPHALLIYSPDGRNPRRRRS